MKAHFKYAFLSGLYVRGITFAVVFILNTTFIILGSAGVLPFPAHITAVALGGIGIAVMIAANIGADVAIARRMFSAPGAYLYALTPSPRWKTLLASVLTMAAMDIVTMTAVITQQVWLAFNMVGNYFLRDIWNIVQNQSAEYLYMFWNIPLGIATYLFVLLVILFCVTANKSIFYKMPAAGFLSFLLALGCFYIASLTQLLIAPFGSVVRYGLLIMIYLGKAETPALIVLTLAQAAVLFVLTSKLMERKINL